MASFLGRLLRKQKRRSLISEPINIVTGALGAGKTLFAIEQADLLRVNGDADVVYQLGINKPDTRKLPLLPFPLEEWHIRADAGELKNAVIILDEFHQWMPQRAQNSRPPAFIEAMAEARKRDVRFLLLTQSGEFDHFLKGTRLNRHFYVSRKAGLGRATIYEWMNRFVSSPEENEPARKQAIKHLWTHPWREYGDWYESAKAHRFRVRLPLRIWVVPVFLVGMMYFVFKLFQTMGPIFEGDIAGAPKPSGSGPVPVGAKPASDRQAGKPVVTADPVEYAARFTPLIQGQPWSAPAYQDRDIVAEPEIYCMSWGRNGRDGCKCLTEQGTPTTVSPEVCRALALGPSYNPYRRPAQSRGEPDGKALTEPQPAAAAFTPWSLHSGSSEQQWRYGGFRGVSESER